jgi:hypothetical protein
MGARRKGGFFDRLVNPSGNRRSTRLSNKNSNSGPNRVARKPTMSDRLNMFGRKVRASLSGQHHSRRTTGATTTNPSTKHRGRRNKFF